MLVVSSNPVRVCEREEGVVALDLPIGPLKPAQGWICYRDANLVRTSPLVDDITTVPSGTVEQRQQIRSMYGVYTL